MIRFFSLCICLMAWIIPGHSQVQTLHNTIAKGTLNFNGGLFFPSIKDVQIQNLNPYTFGLQYVFKHHYSFGIVGSTFNTSQQYTLTNQTIWNSTTLLLGFQLDRQDHLFKTQMGKFKITSLFGINGGIIGSRDELIEQLQVSKSAFRATGYYVSGDVGIRFEILRKVFLVVKESGGYLDKNGGELRTMNQTNLSINRWYNSTQVKLGIFMFINTLDKCGTCPKW